MGGGAAIAAAVADERLAGLAAWVPDPVTTAPTADPDGFMEEGEKRALALLARSTRGRCCYSPLTNQHSDCGVRPRSQLPGASTVVVLLEEARGPLPASSSLRGGPESQRERGRAYYWANREQVLEKAAAKRGRPRPPEQTSCSECAGPLEGASARRAARRAAVMRGSAGCTQRPYAERERQKVERRRERRRASGRGVGEVVDERVPEVPDPRRELRGRQLGAPEVEELDQVGSVVPAELHGQAGTYVLEGFADAARAVDAADLVEEGVARTPGDDDVAAAGGDVYPIEPTHDAGVYEVTSRLRLIAQGVAEQDAADRDDRDHGGGGVADDLCEVHRDPGFILHRSSPGFVPRLEES